MTDPDLRAGDADRDRYAHRLITAHEEGRLDEVEFMARLDAVYGATTFGDLDATVGDLPPESSAAVPGPPTLPVTSRTSPVARSGGSHSTRAHDGGLRAAWTAWGIASGVNLVIWVMVFLSAGDAPYFWPMWVAGPWGAVLLVLTISGLGDRRK